jgi:hypothetical protein
MAKIIPIQNELCQPLPNIIGNTEYEVFKALLERINELLELSGLDRKAVEIFLEKTTDKNKILKEVQQHRLQVTGRKAFRCMLTKELTNLAFRPLSARLADSPLLQNFCFLSQLDRIQIPAKSTLERWEKIFDEEALRVMVGELIQAASCPSQGEAEKQRLLLEKEISLIDYYLDTTCIKANIHYPVDWLLLRDATRTLMKATILIRERGLKKRMEAPEIFVKEMNKLCISMTHARDQKDSKKKRKKIFRLMKKLMKAIKEHSLRHRELLAKKWEETDLSQAEAEQILKRMDNVIEQLPQAIKQAHERIIGERKVKNEDKIFSLYEADVQCVVRKKAGAFAEFGNKYLLGEQADGLIVDWMLYKGKVPGDAPLLNESLERFYRMYGFYPKSTTTDRGFFSKKNQKSLEENKIKDYMCPKPVKELKKKTKSKKFMQHQERRAED